MSKTPEWYMEFYEQYRAIIDAGERDVSIATSPIKCRIDGLPYIHAEMEDDIVGRLFCQELIQICTANQVVILNYVLEGNKIYEIAEDMERDQRNVSQALRRIRKRFIGKGIVPEDLR